MYSIVKRLWVKGVRRPDREIYVDPGSVGCLTMCTVANCHELKLFAVGNAARPELIIPLLFDPVLVSMHGDEMLFRGGARAGDPIDPRSASIMQE